ncbi:MAG: nuclear transport factor 2 family protein [Actinomycetota bacterium]|nr:nuclear transport factor 2 family protein [Actinomycetota bacterium]
MADNVGTLKKGYEAYGQGDLDGALEHWADDAVWEGSNSEELPGGGTAEGKDAIKQTLARIPEFWESFTVTPDEYVEDGDTVVVLGHSEGKAKETGDSVKQPWVHVYRMEDGQVKRIQLLNDTYQTAQVLGIA